MRMWPISSRVNSPDNNDAALLEPIEPRHDSSAAAVEIPTSAPRKHLELTFGLLRLSDDQIKGCSLFLGYLAPELRERSAS